MAVETITNKEQFDNAIKYEGLSVCDFKASWCGPCKVIAPRIEQLSGQFSNSKFYEIDVDDNPDVAQENGISAMPTILFFKNGEKVDSILGANPQKLTQLVQEYSA